MIHFYADCSLKSFELFVATSYQSSAQSGDQHEFWIRAEGKNHYYVLPVPPGLGGHITWELEISDFRPEVSECLKEEDIEEMFFKERGNDAWIIQVVTIHYVYWCDKKTLGPDFHHFNRRLDGDNTPSEVILELIP